MPAAVTDRARHHYVAAGLRNTYAKYAWFSIVTSQEEVTLQPASIVAGHSSSKRDAGSRGIGLWFAVPGLTGTDFFIWSQPERCTTDMSAIQQPSVCRTRLIFQAGSRWRMQEPAAGMGHLAAGPPASPAAKLASLQPGRGLARAPVGS
jgi:hypothetical protein